MLHPPRRSVTRFFIPLVDVMMLLFCIFLLMPMVETSGPAPNADDLTRQLNEALAERDRLREQGVVSADLEAKIKALEDSKKKLQEGSVVVRVLEIDQNDGTLYKRGVERRALRNARDVKAMIDEDHEELRQHSDPRKLHYLILYPPPPTDFPLAGVPEEYRDEWFRPQGVEISFVTPRGGLSFTGN